MHKGAFGAQHCKGEQCSLSAKSLGHGFAVPKEIMRQPLFASMALDGLLRRKNALGQPPKRGSPRAFEWLRGHRSFLRARSLV